MYEVETQDMSPEFLECWKAAGIHISNQVQGGLQSWLKATPFPPVKEAVRPPNWEDIADGCAPTGEIGHFASVAVASADDPFDPTGDSAVPLYRGHAMHVRYEGLQ